MNDRPNILWYCTDQQRYDTIGALGNPHVHTPAMDRLVGRGTAFTTAYCQSPICTPSRASFLTGMYPSTVGANKNGVELFPNKYPLITKTLSDLGWECGLIGKLHLATAAAGWSSAGNLGLVLGATYPEQLKSVRRSCPGMPFLIPGVGAQGGDLAAAVRDGVDANGRRAIINSSRGIIYASTGKDFADAARRETARLKDAINQILEAGGQGWH